MRQNIFDIARLSSVLGLVIVSGCSTLGIGSDTTQQQASSSAQSDAIETPVAADGQTLGVLTETQLPNRSCGMILWTLDANRPSPVFRYVSGKEAEIVVNDETIAFTRIRGTGDSGFGIYQYQEFESEAGLRLEVTSEFGAEFDGGSYLEQGLVKVHAPTGWSIVAPAAGIAGCRS